MKWGVLILLFCPLLGFGASEYEGKWQVEAYEAHLEDKIFEVRLLYGDDAAFITAFEKSQTHWDESYAKIQGASRANEKLRCLKARTEELMKFTEGAAEGDITRGTIKLKKDLEKIRQNTPVERIPVQMVSYAGTDPGKTENRLFVVFDLAFRTLEDLKKYLVSLPRHPDMHFVMQGIDVRPAPEITQEEIDNLRNTCHKAHVWFTFEPGG